MKRLIFGLVFALAIATVPMAALAHPGNTDSSGCHTCRTNCSSWGLSSGEYHCHNNKGYSQPESPIHSVYGSSGTGYTVPAPDYAYPSAPPVPSCPSMSSYDSISGGCKCYSGYVVGTDYSGRESCVSADSKCTDVLGYGGKYNSLSEKCECRYSYLYDGNKCVSEISYCNDRLEIISQYNSLYDKCECMVGYEFDGVTCSYKKLNVCPLNSHESPYDSDKCLCDTGYQLNLAKDACVYVPPAPVKPVVTPAVIQPTPVIVPVVTPKIDPPVIVPPKVEPIAPIVKAKTSVKVATSSIATSTKIKVSSTTTELTPAPKRSWLARLFSFF